MATSNQDTGSVNAAGSAASYATQPAGTVTGVSRLWTSGQAAPVVERSVSVVGASTDITTGITSVNAGVEATSAATVAAPSVTSTLGAAAGTVGTALAAASAVAIGGGAVMGLIKSVLGPWRIAPSVSLTVGGLPAMKQLSGLGALKQFANNITSGAKAGYKGLQAIEGKVLGTVISAVAGQGSSNPNAASTPVTTASNIVAASAIANVDTTKVNPYSTALIEDMVFCKVLSTATTSTVIYLAGNTGTSAGAVFWQVQQDFASTATGSYQSIFYSAKLLTDGLCGVSQTSGIMSLEDIIKSSSTSTFGSGVITMPSVGTFAGTLYYSDFINSSTVALANLIIAANTSTSTVAQITTLRSNLNLYTQNLSNRVNADINNQITYLTQMGNIGSVANAAKTLTEIRSNQPLDIINLYQSTINPALYNHINTLSILSYIDSSNTATAAAAVSVLTATTAT
jgi:hypothetical protein